MTQIEGAAELQIKFDRLLVGVSDQMVAKTLTGIGQDITRRDMPDGFKADLGSDKAMTNWPRRGDKMELLTGYNVDGKSLTVEPRGKSVGPLRMLESGRNVRKAGQFRSRGTRTRKKDGSTYTRIVQLSRTVGPMAPKKTWSDGTEVVERRLPSRLEDWLRAVRRQAFGG